MKYFQNGGLLLTEKFPSTFDAIYKMIEKSKEIKPLYMSSLKGFVFVLNIDEKHSLFYTLNEEKTKLDKKVNSLIIKFALTSERPEDIKPPLVFQGYEHKKQTDSDEDVINEVSIQQKIYLESIKNTGNPIVPGIADFSYFDTGNAFIILDKLLEHSNNNESKQVLKYLKLRLTENPTHPEDNKGYKLSMICMENASSYVQIIDAYTGKFTLEERRDASMTTIAQMLRLFLQTGIVHCDAHGGNILTARNKLYKRAGTNETSSMHVKLIDFGRFVNVYDDLYHPFYTKMFGPATIELVKDLFRNSPSETLVFDALLNDFEFIKNISDEAKEMKKIKTEYEMKLILIKKKEKIFRMMKNLFSIILLIDRNYNISNFKVNAIQSSTIFRYLKIINMDDKGNFQMYETKDNVFQQEKYLDILKILHSLMRPNKKIDNVSKKSIDNFISEQRFTKIEENKPSTHNRDVKPYVKVHKITRDINPLGTPIVSKPKRPILSKIKNIFTRKKNGGKKKKQTKKKQTKKR